MLQRSYRISEMTQRINRQRIQSHFSIREVCAITLYATLKGKSQKRSTYVISHRAAPNASSQNYLKHKRTFSQKRNPI